MNQVPERSSGDLRLPLSAVPGEVSRARRVFRAWLRTVAVRTAEDTTLLLVSEMVTNALLHARPPLELRARALPRGGVRIEVLDASGGELPVLGVAKPEADGGRGVRIVAALSNRWGTEPHATGKLVWAEIDPLPAPTRR